MDKQFKTACFLAAWVCFMVCYPGTAQNKDPKKIEANSNRYNDTARKLSLPVVKSSTAKGNPKQANSETAESLPYRVVFPTPVPINSHKDPWDKALVVLTGALVTVGGFQILFLWRTVQATSENAKAAQAQATHAEAAARSAAENAEAASSNARAVEAQGTTLRETLEAIKRQADIMELQVRVMQQSAEMQEIGMRQWVSLTNWNVERVEGQKALFVHFKIENPTDIPLTLDAALLQLGDERHNGLNVSGPLTPESPREVTTIMKLTDQKLASFEESSLTIVAQCSILYRDSLNRKWQQIFTCILLCGPSKTEVIKGGDRITSSELPIDQN